MTFDQRILKHKKPCKDCPFRKTSMKGYFGGFPMNTYLNPTEAGLPTSCHKHDKGVHTSETRLCAGSLGVIKNDPNIEPWDHVKEAVELVDGSEVFNSIAEIKEHHEENHVKIYSKIGYTV